MSSIRALNKSSQIKQLEIQEIGEHGNLGIKRENNIL